MSAVPSAQSGRGALRVGIVGFGTIGAAVARALDAGIDGLALVGVHTRTPAKALATLAGFAHPVPVVALTELVECADVIVDCAPVAGFARLAQAALGAGRTLVTVSGAALLDHAEFVDLARARGGRIILASGAILGLDALRAAALGTIHSVRMVTRKPPRALAGSPYLVTHGIDVGGLREPLRVFSGTAAEGARGFPSNVNVAAAIGLAGIGADATTLEIWADPQVSRNSHEISVEADSARFTMRIENIPSANNPATGRITALSVIATMRRLVSPLTVGT
jgi:aspartate dehydrogenase